MSPKKNTEEAQTEVIEIPTGTPPAGQLARYEPENNDIAITAVFDVKAANKRLDELKLFVKDYLVADEDYGTIPGTQKPTLYKSGADKLCDIYGMADEYTCTNRVEDWDRGLFDYEFKCRLSSRRTGRLIGTGVGSCSSYETKYRYRDQKRVCPKCHKETIIKGKEEFGGGWLCWKKRDGCGANFKEDDPAIIGQVVGRAQNEDVADQKNTILKMAKKRAKIDAVISATRSSGLFTQDMEDAPREEEAAKPPVPTGTKPPQQQAPRPAAAPRPAQPAAKPVAKPPAPPPQEAPAPKPPRKRSDILREIVKITGLKSDAMMTFLCRHFGCDSQTINSVPGKHIDAIAVALEACLKKFPATSVKDLIVDNEHVTEQVKRYFLDTYANLVKE